MKNQLARIIKSTSFILLLAFGTGGAVAGDPNPEVFPINSSPHGRSYGSWTEAWWQWALSIPAAHNPQEDTTGENAGIGQRGPVWFMAGGFGDLGSPVVRSFTVPHGKILLQPVYFWIFGASVGDCDPSNPGVTCHVPTLRASAAAAATSVKKMEVSIDGVPVKDVRKYHAISPTGFSVNLPPANVLQFLGISSDVAGTYAPQVSDGYWLMIKPLSTGRHTVSVHVVPDPAVGAEQLYIYHLKVLPEQDNCDDDDD